jgi:hypothetical protein
MITEIYNAADLQQLIRACGFLPFFANAVPGWSVEEHTPENLWFSDTEEGPWEWKGPVLGEREFAYGKFFQGRAGFIEKSRLSDFFNLRRDGYDFDSRLEEGLTRPGEADLMALLQEKGPIRSRDLRALAGYTGKGARGRFDALITSLEMKGYITTTAFAYDVTKDGRPYGWGVAVYDLPEHTFGRTLVRSAYRRSPARSAARIEAPLLELFGPQYEEEIRTIIETV